MHTRPLSITLLLIAVIIWGGSYIVTKSGLSELPPMIFALLRYCVASVVLIPLAVARGGMSKLPRRVPWRTLILMSLSGVGVYYFLFNLSLAYTTASQVALIQSSIPAITAILAALWLGERVSRMRILGIALAVAGVALVVARTPPDANARDPLLGSVLAFASVLVWGVYTILAKRIANADAIAVTTIVTVLGTVLLIPAALIENGWTSIPSISTDGWLKIAYVGALSSAVSYLLYNRALRDVDATLAGIFINLSPVIGVVSGVVVLGESITTLGVVGGVLALVGVWISTVRSRTSA